MPRTGRDHSRQSRKLLRWLSLVLIVVGLCLLLIPPGQWALAAWAQYRWEQKFLAANAAGSGMEPRAAGTGTLWENSGAKIWERILASIWEDPALTLPEHLREEWSQLNRPDPELLKDFPGAMIRIPAIKARAIVLWGTSPRILAQGPGFYETSVLPGHPGHVTIAGHRTTYGAWFRHLDRVQPGDVVELEYQRVVYKYEVERVWVIDRYDWSVVAPTGESILTLTTCHPPGSAAQRLALRARLVETVSLY